MKKLVLVIGRSGAGKDTLVREAQKVFGATSIPSYTDRPIRSTETDGIEHTFITPGQFDELLANEQIFAYTKIGDTGYRYCTTVRMLDELPGEVLFYIIDPSGYDYCKAFASKFDLKVVYVTADSRKREERANARNGDSTAWTKRSADEDAQFTAFEKAMPWDAIVENNGDIAQASLIFNREIGRLYGLEVKA